MEGSGRYYPRGLTEKEAALQGSSRSGCMRRWLTVLTNCQRHGADERGHVELVSYARKEKKLTARARLVSDSSCARESE